ncbi:MAG: cyclase family protein [Armatimonadetes bacterium]|nr:cyclase family protein [Armatimonadota bacterium]
MVDLTLPIRLGMPVYPGDPAVTFAPRAAADPAERAFAVASLTLGTHTGTHLDAPAHVLPRGAGVDALPLEACLGPARVVDATGLERIGLPELRRRVGEAAPGERLLIRTDWDRHFGCPRYYEDFPGLTLAAARWLAERRIALLGLETPSVCIEAGHAAHLALLGAGVVIVEGLARLRDIPSSDCWLAALPLPLAGLDGSPVRAVAWVESLI